MQCHVKCGGGKGWVGDGRKFMYKKLLTFQFQPILRECSQREYLQQAHNVHSIQAVSGLLVKGRQ